MNAKNLVEVISQMREANFSEIKNAKGINHHVLPNGLHIYQFLNENGTCIFEIGSNQGKMLIDYINLNYKSYNL